MSGVPGAWNTRRGLCFLLLNPSGAESLTIPGETGFLVNAEPDFGLPWASSRLFVFVPIIRKL